MFLLSWDSALLLTGGLTQEEVTPTLSSRPHRHVGSRSTGHTPVSCSLSLPFHTHVRGLHIGCLGCGATVNSDVFWEMWDSVQFS